MVQKRFNVEVKEEWKAPAGSGAFIITMPNVPRPLHGLPPRKIMGQTEWDKMRKRCYYNADYKCEVCGAEPERGGLDAHELYTVNWVDGTSTFIRCVALCKKCHSFIHSGRLITLHKQGNPLYQREHVLSVVEHGFKLIHEHNQKYHDNLRAYATFLEYLKVPTLTQAMLELIKKYNIKFYSEPLKIADWGDWRLIWRGKEYRTPYKSEGDWQKAMAEYSKTDTKRQVNNPFTGGVYDVIKRMKENS